MKKKFKKLTVLISLLLCFSLAFNITAFAGKLPQDSDKKLSVERQCGVLLWESIQLKATYGGEITNNVTWSSSDESVIYCSSSGEIIGLKAGCYADITCQHIITKETQTMRVYCVERASVTKSVYFDTLLVSFYAQPKTGTVAHTYFNLMPILYAFMQIITVFPQSFYIGYFQPCTLCGRAGDYVYIRFGEELQYDGFVKGERIIGSLSGTIKLSRSNIIVWGNGVADPEKKLTASNADNVNWTVDDAQVVAFNHKTGQVTGLKPGTTTIRAKADGIEKICYVYSLYKWPLEWTGELIDGTYLLSLSENKFYQNIILGQGSKFTVYGDMGTSDGYVYGYTEDGIWGFVHISEISTKGTISQYKNMKTTIIENGKEKKIPWVWPVLNEIDGVSQSKNANYISSPYAPRSDSTSETIHHRGMDITTGTAGEIKKYSVVSAVSGTVKAIRSNIDSCGFCISISSDCTDLVTGQNIAIIYMHLYEAPKYSNGKIVQVGDKIYANTIIGKVGKTNGNTSSNMGYHLHFEANNRNAAVGDIGRSDFTNTINPIYFYLDKSIRINNGSEACKNGYTAYLV